MRRIGWITQILVRRLLIIPPLALLKFTVTGTHHVPARGPVLLACNHISLLDPPLLGSVLRRPVVVIAMAELWSIPIVGTLMSLLGAIRFRRGDADSGRQALNEAETALRHGALVAIFPEGRCAAPGEVVAYRPGIARLALATGAPIVPAAITGTNDVLPLPKYRIGGRKFNPTKPMRLRLGPPIDPGNFSTPEDMLAELRRQITALGAS